MSKSLFKLFITIALLTLLIACSNETISNQQHPILTPTPQFQLTENESDTNIISDETIEKDFKLNIYSNKIDYKQGDNIIIYAELTYIGEKKEITIGHGGSPIGFNLYEKTRDIHVNGAMTTPYIRSTLKKDEAFKRELNGIGGYSEQDDKFTIAFNKATMKMDFMEGIYTITATAAFEIDDKKIEDNTNYFIKVAIDITVLK